MTRRIQIGEVFCAGGSDGARHRGRCPHYTRFLQDYVDGELPKRQARDFERHIGNCPGCTAFLNTYRVTRSLGRSLPEPRIPKELVERIVKVLCPSKGGHQGKSTEGAAKAGIQNRTAAASRKTRRRAIQGR